MQPHLSVVSWTTKSHLSFIGKVKTYHAKIRWKLFLPLPTLEKIWFRNMGSYQATKP